MYYLLDTHVCIWAIAEQNKLSSRVKEILEDSGNGFFVSKMSFFEIAIKLKIGKLAHFNVTLSEFIDTTYRSGYNTLAIRDEHFKAYSEINFRDTHRDPFDRYLSATAHHEDLGFITKDEKFDFYKKDYPIIW